MGLPLEKPGYTYQDYLKWPENERWEIINGEAYCMSPAPSTRHQIISRNFVVEIVNALRRKSAQCSVFDAPTDVVFDEYNVVQPDVFVVCDREKITENNISGPPELIIEIVSKTSVYKDTKIKKELYEKFGVIEYVLVFMDLEIVERYVLEKDRYGAPDVFNWDETMKLKSIEVEVNLREIFEKSLRM